jgi:Family of unknown function (DUF6496)
VVCSFSERGIDREEDIMPAKTTTTKTRTRRAKGAGTRRYGKAAGRKVERAMREMKRGELRSGRSGKKVTNPKQAIAIGLSEARARGAKVPRARA